MFERITIVEAERQVALEREREANRAKDEFLATLSHELRTPLSAILGWTQLMRRKFVPPEEFARGLERIERNAHAQNRLINDLLDLSRILSGKMSLQRQAADLTAITRVIVESMMPSRSSCTRTLATESSWPSSTPIESARWPRTC
jgi:signal transduction histidine kinase